MQVVAGSGKGHVEDIQIIHPLALGFLLIVLAEEGLHGIGAQFDRVYAGKFLKITFGIQGAPVHLRLVQRHLVRIREDDIRILQTLGLVYGDDAHGILPFRRTYYRRRPFPMLEEGSEVVAVILHPSLYVIHKGLYIKKFPVKRLRVGLVQGAQQALAEVGQGAEAGRVLNGKRFHQIGGNGVVRIQICAQKGTQPADQGRGFHAQGILGNHRYAIGYQHIGQSGTLLLVAHEHRHVTVMRPGIHCIPDRREHEFILVVGEAHPYPSALGLGSHHILVDVSVQGGFAELGGCKTEETVVEFHYCGRTSPIALHNFRIRSRETGLHTLVEQLPVRIAEAVYALLDVSDYEIFVVVRIAFLQQRQEIHPLYIGGVLELVQQEMLETYAHLLVHERRIAASYDVLEDSVGVVQAHHVLLPEQGVEGGVELPRQSHTEQQFAYDPGTVVTLYIVLGVFLEFGVCTEEPLFSCKAESGTRLRHRETQLLHPCLEAPDYAVAKLAHPLELFLVGAAVVIHPLLLAQRPVLLGLEQLAHFVEILLHLGLVSPRQAAPYALAYPVEHFLILVRDTVQDAVHSLIHEGILVKFDTVVRELPDFPGEGLEHLLEETVYGADRKGTVIVKHAHEHIPGTAVAARKPVKV